MRWSWLFSAALLLASFGCASTTGQVESLETDKHGDLSVDPPTDAGVAITKGDVFSIRLTSVFVRHLREIGDGELLIYMEVFDKQPDDRARLVKTLVKEVRQPEGFLVNQRDRLAYGPIEFNGRPVRIRLIVIELDRKDNEVMSAVIKTAAQIGATSSPSFAPFAGTVTSVGDLFLALNTDDRELVYDFTLYPNDTSEGPRLRTGHQVLIKTESSHRNLPSWLPFVDGGVMSSATGEDIEEVLEDYPGLHTYPDEPDHPLAVHGDITPLIVLRVAGSQLWLETVALEHKNQGVILAAARFCEAQRASGRDCAVSKDPLPSGYSIREYSVGGVVYPELVVRENNAIARTFRVGKRFQYTEKTHAIITLTRGGEAVERTLLEEISTADEGEIAKLLQEPLTTELLQEKLDAVRDNLLKLQSRKSAVKEVNAGLSDDDRKSPKFPMAFLQRLKPNASAELENGVVVEIVSSMVSGFPYTVKDAGNTEKIAKMIALTEKQFCPLGNGTFKFASSGCPAAAPAPGAPVESAPAASNRFG